MNNIYKAFISYSHAADDKLAPSLQSALHQFAKPWYKLRAIRVFRDKTSLSANPALWKSIEKALSESEYFLIMASPEAAESPWVKKEIEYWIKNKDINKMLILLTDGELSWNNSINDFDWETTNSLPQVLKNVYSEEPFYIDMRWARTEEQLSLNNPRFRDNIADLASTLHQIPKDELIGNDVRLRKNAMRLAWGAGISLLFLFIAALGFGIFSYIQKNEADRQRIEAENQRDLTVSKQLASQSEFLNLKDSRNTPLSILLAIESINRKLTYEGFRALFYGIKAIPHLQAWTLSELDDRFVGVKSMAFHPSGDMILTSHKNSSNSAYNLPDLSKSENTFNMERNLSHFEYSPNGEYIATHTGYGPAKIYNSNTGELIDELGDNVYSFAFSPDNNYFATGEKEDLIRIWDLNSKTEKLQILMDDNIGRFGNHVLDIEIDPKGKLLVAVAEGGLMKVYDIDTGKEIPLIDDKKTITNVEFSPDGKYLLTSEFLDEDKYVVNSLDVETKEHLKLFEHTEPINVLVLNKNNTLLIIGSYDNTVRIINVGDKSLAAKLPHMDPISDIELSPDEKYLAVGTYNESGGPYSTGTLRLWSMNEITTNLKIPHKGNIYGIKYSPDSRYIIVTDRYNTFLYDTATFEVSELPGNKEEVYDILFSPSNKYIAIQLTDTIVVLNLSDRATVLEVPTEEITPYPDQEIKSISFNNSDDDLFLVVSRKASRVWDLKTGEILASINHEKYEDKIITGKISPDGKWIASGSDSIKDRTRVGPGGSSPVLVNANLRIININNGNVYKKFDHKNHVSFMKFSPDGRYLLSVYNQPTWPTGSGPPKTISFIRVYDTSNWKERFTNEYSQVIKSANFSPDSNLIALSLSDSQTYSRGDKEGWNTAVINTKKGKEIISIDHPNDVIDSIISPDMKSIGIATSGGVFSIYNLSTGEKYGEINHKHSIDSFDISPDSKWVAVGGLDSNARWNSSIELWKIDVNELVHDACNRLIKNMTTGDWKIYIGEDIPYRCTCPSLPPDNGALTKNCNLSE